MRVVTIVNALTGALFIQELVEQGHEVAPSVSPPGPRPGADPATSPKLSRPPVAARSTNRALAPSTPPFVTLLERLQPDLSSPCTPGNLQAAHLEIPPLGVIGGPLRLPRPWARTPPSGHAIGDPQAWMSRSLNRHR